MSSTVGATQTQPPQRSLLTFLNLRAAAKAAQAYFFRLYTRCAQAADPPEICQNVDLSDLGNFVPFLVECGTPVAREGLQRLHGTRGIESDRVWARTEPWGPDLCIKL